MIKVISRGKIIDIAWHVGINEFICTPRPILVTCLVAVTNYLTEAALKRQGLFELIV